MNLNQDLYSYMWTQMTVNNCNSYLLAGPPTALFDPGHSQLYGHVETGMSEDGFSQPPEMVILTHCHPDHMEAAVQLQEQGSKLAMHPKEVEYMYGEGRALAAALGMSFPEVEVDVFLEQGDLALGKHELKVFHTPGHSPGHICIYDPDMKTLIAGDLIFAQGVGRVDFPGGSGEDLKESIRQMAELDIELILPGHGPIIKGADNVKQNFDLIASMYFGMI